MKRAFLFVFLLAFVCASVAAAFIFNAHEELNKPLGVQGQQEFVVMPGDSVNKIAYTLENKKLVSSAFAFRIYARLNNLTDIKAGEYSLLPTDTSVSFLNKLVAGEVISYSVTLVEGWTFKQSLEQLHSQPKLIKRLLDDESLQDFFAELNIPNMHPEGWFFPDTYHFSSTNTDRDILITAYGRMRDTLLTEWENRSENLPYANDYEALIMASIVEKETGLASEREEIAGVFVRRLQQNMRLQTDPTVIYGMGERYDGNIRRRDLQEPTPYNTYVIKGLPPTPIALPGKEAISAALHPAEGSSLYFVAKGDGSHQFSDTLEQHNKAVREYQLNRRQEYRSSPPANQGSESQ